MRTVGILLSLNLLALFVVAALARDLSTRVTDLELKLMLTRVDVTQAIERSTNAERMTQKAWETLDALQFSSVTKRSR